MKTMLVVKWHLALGALWQFCENNAVSCLRLTRRWLRNQSSKAKASALSARCAAGCKGLLDALLLRGSATRRLQINLSWRRPNRPGAENDVVAKRPELTGDALQLFDRHVCCHSMEK